MPGLNGTGPKGEGPMTGQGDGYCIIKKDSNNPNIIEGLIGSASKKITQSLFNERSGRINKNLKEVLMPGGDGTGPAGYGSMTGRAAGYCADYSTPGYANPMGGRGFFGRGRSGFSGRGYRNMYYATGLPGISRFDRGYPARGDVANAPYPNAQHQITPEQEIDMLKNQAKYMKEDIDNVNKRIKELEKKPTADEK